MMVDEESAAETKSLLDELERQFTTAPKNTPGVPTDNFTQYIIENQKLGYIPDNPYGHASWLINSKSKKFEMDGLDVLDDPQIHLGFMEDPKTMRIYQMELAYLTGMATLALQDLTMRYVFCSLWKQYRNEVRMTTSMSGAERQYQAFHIPQQVKKKGFGFLRPKQKKREPIEYIFPQEDEGDMY